MGKTELVHSFLLNSAEQFPDKTALVQRKERISYSQLQGRAEALCNWLLAHNLQPGDRVAILTDQAGEYVAAYFAVLAAGGIVVGINTQTSSHALNTVFSDSGCSIVLSHKKYSKYFSKIETHQSIRHLVTDIPALWDSGNKAKIVDFPSVTTEDIAQIIYTSGTTGTPKGVMLSHRNLTANTRSIVEYLALSESDSVMAVLPFFYSYGNSVLLTHIAVGGTLVVNQSFLYPNVILDQMKAEKVTGFSGVPSSFAILLHRSAIRNYNFPKLRYVTQAGAAMSPRLAAVLVGVFPDTDIYIMYGQTEASARLSYLEPAMIVEKAGSIGKAIPHVRLEVCAKDGRPAAPGEVGEIVAEGANIMSGYWQRPAETAQVLKNGRLWTGDLAKVDDDGFLFIQSRKSDMIKSGSHRIAPKEIEEMVMECGDVHDVAVVGQEDEILGEKIVAFVVLKQARDTTAKDILRHCRRNLQAFKVPHEIYFKNELPKTDTGKIKKSELKK